MKDCVTLSVEIAKEVTDNLSRVDPEATEALLEAIREAKRVFFAGRGRSLLMLRGLAMRLMHLGLCVYVTGETVTPAAGPGDLLLIGSGSGETTTLVPLAQQAHKLGMRVALLTIFPDSTLARLADHVVVIPGTSGKSLETTRRSPCSLAAICLSSPCCCCATLLPCAWPNAWALR